MGSSPFSSASKPIRRADTRNNRPRDRAVATTFDKVADIISETSEIDRDTITPDHLNRRNFNRYRRGNGSVLDFRMFPGRNHFVVGQPTWREDADYILDWLGRN